MHRTSVPKCADIASPLNNIITEGQAVEMYPFGDAEAFAFTALVSAVTSTPMLAIPKPGLYYEV